MPTRARLLAAAATGYLLGAFPSADLAAKAASGGRIDLRDEGSGNPGATNASRVLGKNWGTAVLAADVAKGAAACALGRRIAGDEGAHLAGSASVVGHCWPVTAGFRGGKGVATGAGQMATTFPAFLPIDLALALGAVKVLKLGAAPAAALACAAWVGGGALWWRRDWPNLWGPRPSRALPAAAAVSSAVILRRFSR